MKNKTEFLTKSLIAHCGVHDIENKIPENSIKAFEIAISKGYIIELDLHILKDNNVVVFHDDNLFRITGVNKRIRDCTYDEIKLLKLQNTNNHMPLFKEVLELVNEKVPLLIELKYDTKVGKLENEVMNILNKYKGEYAIQSFNPISLIFMKKYFPNVVRGQISSNFKNVKLNSILKYILKNMCFNFVTRPDFISYDINSVPNRKVKRYRKKHIVLGWTIKSREDLKKAKKYFDNFICENIL